MKVRIKNSASYLPERIVSNQEIIERESLKMKASWVEKRIGINERRWAADEECASELAFKAIEKLKLDNFDGSLWLSSISNDYLTPSTSSVLKSRLKLENEYPTFDINAACAGHIFALEMAANRLKTGEFESEAIVIASELRSLYLNPKDRRTVFLFGDGAVAFHLEVDQSNTDLGLEWTVCKTLRSDSLDIFIPGGGSVRPYSTLEDPSDIYIKMNDGPKIFELTTNALVDNIVDHLKLKNMSLSEYDFFVFHQGNMKIIKTVLERLDIPFEKTLANFDKFGNTSSASMGIALTQALEEGKISQGSRVLMLAMGAGHHMGMASVVWG